MATDNFLNSLFTNKNFPVHSEKSLPSLKLPENPAEALIILHQISEIISNLTTSTTAEQLPLNLSYAAYCHLLHKYDLSDADFGNLLKIKLCANNVISFQKLYAILQTTQWQKILEAQLQLQQLLDECVNALHVALKQNKDSVLIIIKCLNLLNKKWPALQKCDNIKLETFYDCLQHGQEFMREETLILFTNYCKSNVIAFNYFKVIVYCWPWTNRNKLYLLNCIINAHNLTTFLNDANYSTKEFFTGLRLSLSYKKLFAPSQYLIKSISSKQSHELLELAVEILTCGTQFEVKNFYSQWFSRINKQQQQKLFELLQQRTETVQFLANINSNAADVERSENFRLIIILNMFSVQIFNVSKLYFFKISTELITNCFQFDIESQLHIYRFIVENFTHFAIEDCIEFILNFMKMHKSIESAQFRHSLLSKVPFIINYIANTFNKLKNTIELTTLEKSIQAFFLQLHQMIDEDLKSNIYQPKIFSLKLLNILCTSLYVDSITKNTKNCILLYNQKLGKFLIERKVVDLEQLKMRLLLQMIDKTEIIDDVVEIITDLLQQLLYTDTMYAYKLCQNIYQNCDNNIYSLTTYLMRVTMRSLQINITNDKAKYNNVALKFYQDALFDFEMKIKDYQIDPFLCCQKKQQLFGPLFTMDEILLHQPLLLDMNSIKHLLDLLQNVIDVVLEFLNLAKAANNGKQAVAASSFQDMDKSLEIIVKNSAAYDEVETTEYRQMLLMSFWLTLKSCCNLAATIGCNLITTSVANQDVDINLLEHCLHINVQVLTCCRHKGAIESAGLSIGKLTKSITSQLPVNSNGYNLLQDCLKMLFSNNMQVSTTRRGAGFSIMLLHIVKNEENQQQTRPRVILQKVLQQIFASLSTSQQNSSVTNDSSLNFDRLEALALHYLCVLVKDTELRQDISKYYNEIMMTAILHIDHSEWTICNAALQLFGSLVPKILGQKQAVEFSDNDDITLEILDWESTETTYPEVQHKLPKMCEYILNYIGDSRTASTRSIILFLSFLVKVENLRMNFVDEIATEEQDSAICMRIKNLMFHLLKHPCEKVRKLAANCLVRAHDFYLELPFILLKITKLLFSVKNENLFHGLCCTLIEGVYKMKHDCRHTMNVIGTLDMFLEELRLNLKKYCETLTNANTFKIFTLSKLLDLMILIEFDTPIFLYKQLIEYNVKNNSYGSDIWQKKLQKLKCNA